MADIRALPNTFNGKLIYQLTSADALKDTDLLPISTSDNLTRNITLQQLKEYSISGLYSVEDINKLIDNLLNEINENRELIFDLQNDVAAARNEFDDKLIKLNDTLMIIINNLDTKLSERIKALDNQVNTKIDTVNQELNTKIDNVNETLSQRIYNLDKKLEGWIMYGTTIPTSLPEGRMYLQYF